MSFSSSASAASSSASAQSSLPFLPGYRVELAPKERFHKSHIFDVSNGIRVDMNKEKLENRGVGSASSVHPLAISSVPKDYRASLDSQFATPEATMSRLPAWVAYDRKVIRFSGYFKEAVHASAAENWRARKCLIYFYLEDDSMHIAEPKVENSGIPQGVFVKRHRIPKEGTNAFYTIDDLAIGAELAIYGRVFRLTDADAFTRSFYSQNGVELGAGEEVPLDPFTKKQAHSVHSHHKMMNPLKTFMEAALGKPMQAGIDATQKFLQHDGRVLRFYAQWDDDKQYGEIRPYTVHYFLADDTIEVNEVAVPNSGRDPFPSLLKRQKLPKNFHQIGMDISRIGQADDGKVLYYSPVDFRVGGYLQVYGRNLFLCGADDFTREYYKSTYGMSDEDFPRLNMDDPEPPRASIEPPPHNGFGSEEDSLASFLYLMPKVPKADFKKLIELDGVNLRFLAKFKTGTTTSGASQYGGGNKVDQGRRFIVTYYLANDSFQCFEKFERNSGFVGGKFLERDRVRNPNSSNGMEWYKASDFFIGASIIVNKFEFEIIDTDEYTAKFMKNNSHIWGENAINSARLHKQGAFGLESTQQIRETGASNDEEIEARAQQQHFQQQSSSSSQQQQQSPQQYRSRPPSSASASAGRQIVGQHNTGSPRYQ